MRIGLVGLRGVNIWLYYPALRKHPRVELVAGCDIDEEAARRFGEEAGVPTFPSLSDMARSVELDGVIIGTPNQVHLANVEEAAGCGLNVLVTKPMTNTVADSLKAIEACRRAGVVLVTGHEYRFRPVVREMLRRASSGEIGQVSMAQAHMGHRGGISGLAAPGTWRSNRANVPGGSANLLGVHCFDVLNAIFGRPISVQASLKRLISPVLEDTSATIVEYASGGVGFASSSYASSPSDWVRVYGTEANLLADTRMEKLFVERKGGLEEVKVPSSPDSGFAVLDMFVSAVEDGVPPETGGVEGLLAVAVLEASILSSERGRRVEVEEVIGGPIP